MILLCPYIDFIEHETAAKCPSELGNVTRLAIFRYLVKTGPSVTQLQPLRSLDAKPGKDGNNCC